MVQFESKPDPTPGARPSGVSDPAAAAASIQQMFNSIAPTYDRANHLLSAGIDRLWWRRTARALRPILARPEAVVLDLCCGTGDMTLALDTYRPQVIPSWMPHELKTLWSLATIGTAEDVPLSKTDLADNEQRATCNLQPATGNLQPATLLAIDFSRNMLALAQPKFAGRNIRAIEGDALHLPFADASIDLITCAFGFRNLASYPDGLAELYRVLRPAGQIAILDFNRPTGLVGALYNLYFKHILPRIGRLISRDLAAYAYLPESVARFPSPPRMMEMVAAAGFTAATWTPYTFGIAGLYRAVKL